MSNELTQETEADETHKFREYKAIVKVLETYVQTAVTGDGALVKETFFDNATVVGSMNGTFMNTDAIGFKSAVDEFPASPDVESQIAWIDISGPAAAVKLESINWLGTRFTDYLVLYKHEGEWKFTGKVYDAHSKN